MYSSIIGLRVASVIFALVALLQLLRLTMQFEVSVNGHLVPLWPNAIALVVAESESIAAEALKLIEVEYEPLPVVTGPKEAAAPDAPRAL